MTTVTTEHAAASNLLDYRQQAIKTLKNLEENLSRIEGQIANPYNQPKHKAYLLSVKESYISQIEGIKAKNRL